MMSDANLVLDYLINTVRKYIQTTRLLIKILFLTFLSGLHQQETNVIEDWVDKALFHRERAPGHHPQPETTNGVDEEGLFHRGRGQPPGLPQPETKDFEEALFHQQPPGHHHQQETKGVPEDLFHRPRAPGLHQDRGHGHDWEDRESVRDHLQVFGETVQFHQLIRYIILCI